jgi:cardiolipin synthase (CMP-forming)
LIAQTLRWLPNALSLARLVLVPLAVWQILEQRYDRAFIIFALAGVSDAIDGFLARRLDARTALGSVLDPVADKALLVSVYVTLGHAGLLPVWLVILVVFRDALIVLGVLLFHLAGQKMTVAPLQVSRMNTVAQVLCAGWVMAATGFGIAQEPLTGFLIGLAALTTIASGVGYILVWGRRLIGLEL